MLGEGVFKDYDNIVIMTGLNLDKRLLNEYINSTTPSIRGNSLILISNVSDAQVLILLFHRPNYFPRMGQRLLRVSRASSPFCRKNMYHLYGDGPYTSNELVKYVYAQVPTSDLAKELQEYVDGLWCNGMWGWEILSFFFEAYLKRTNSSRLDVGIQVSSGGIDGGELYERLSFLARMAAPHCFYLREGRGQVVLSDTPRSLDPIKTVTIPIMRFIPAFNLRLLRSIFQGLEGKTALVTIGGAEHNIYLNLFTAERRETLDPDSRVLYDYSNAFDRELARQAKNVALLATHDYVGVRIQTAPVHIIDLKRDGDKTGGVIIKMRHTPGFLDNKVDNKIDLFVVFGAGRSGALATKLTFTRLLCDDSYDTLNSYGIYYIIFHSENLNEVYLQNDVVYQLNQRFDSKTLGDIICCEEIRKASRVEPIP